MPRLPMITPAFKRIWLSDPATYPLMAVVGGALSLVAAFGGRKLFFDPDVCLSTKNREAFFPTESQIKNSKTWVWQDSYIKPTVQTVARGVDRLGLVPVKDYWTETGEKSAI